MRLPRIATEASPLMLAHIADWHRTKAVIAREYGNGREEQRHFAIATLLHNAIRHKPERERSAA